MTKRPPEPAAGTITVHAQAHCVGQCRRRCYTLRVYDGPHGELVGGIPTRPFIFAATCVYDLSNGVVEVFGGIGRPPAHLLRAILPLAKEVGATRLKWSRWARGREIHHEIDLT